MGVQILVYLTDQKDRVISGDPLTLLVPQDERETLLNGLEEALHAHCIQLKNGDHLLIKRG